MGKESFGGIKAPQWGDQFTELGGIPWEALRITKRKIKQKKGNKPNKLGPEHTTTKSPN